MPAKNEETPGAADPQEQPAEGLRYVVTYPAISVFLPDGTEQILRKGQTLPAVVAAERGQFLHSIGHVTPIQVPGS